MKPVRLNKLMDSVRSIPGWISTVKRNLIFVLFAAILCLVIFLVGKSNRFSREDGNRNSGIMHEKGAPGTDGESVYSRFRRFMRPGKTSRISYIEEQMIQSPFSAQGVNQYAKAYFKLTDKQADEIAKIALQTRLSLANRIIERLEEVEDPGNSQQAFVFRGSKDISELVKSNLRKELTAIVDERFADACLPDLQTDDRFLDVGDSDIFFYVNPGIKDDDGHVVSLRMEIRDKQGKLGSEWEGPPVNIKETFWLDFDWMPGK